MSNKNRMDITRRSFLLGGSAIIAGAGLGLAGCNHKKGGEEVKGEIEVVGGDVKQEALSILIYLMVEKSNGEIVPYGDYKVYGSFEIEAGKTVTFPFVIELPGDGPFTTEEEQVFLMTNVVKLLAFDQRDKQYIHVVE